jgi:hypothetical protein
MFKRGVNHRAHAFERGQIAGLENIGLVGKQLEDADDFVASQQRHDYYRADTQSFTTLAVDARVGGGVIAAQGLPGADAFAGEARIHLELRADLGRRRSCAGPANHFLVVAQRDGCAGGAGDVLSTLSEELQGSRQITLRHLSQRLATVFGRKAYVILAVCGSCIRWIMRRFASVFVEDEMRIHKNKLLASGCSQLSALSFSC